MILNHFKHWLIHLLTPHCSECLERQLELKVCNSCESLKMQLEVAATEKNKLINIIADFNKPAEQERIEPEIPLPLRNKALTFRATRQMLEQQSRIKARAERVSLDQIKKEGIITESPKMAEIKEQSIEDLEKELGVVEHG